MRINQGLEPKSSFLSIEKDLNIITSTLLKNARLKKMLYYTTKDCLKQPDLDQKQTLELLNKNIKLVPKLYIDNSVLNYIIITFDNFVENATNPEFRDNIISFDIICHFDQWQLKDFQLRPYRIAAEIDSLLDNARLSGIGLLQFLGANQIILNDEYAGISLMYQAIHGGEDEKEMLNPQDQEQFLKDFERMIES